MRVSSEPIPSRLRWGVRNGAGIALIYVLFATLQFVFNANVRSAHGDALVAIATVYLIGGCLGGAIVGLLLPFIRSRAACGMVGFLVILPMAILLHYIWLTNSDWSPDRIAAVLLGSLFIGVPLGVSVGEHHVLHVGDADRRRR